MKKNILIMAPVAFAISLLISGCDSSDSNSITSTPQKDRIENLIDQMTVEEKVSFLHGKVENFNMLNFFDPEDKSNVGFIPGVPRLGIPPLRLSDGPAGVRWTKGLTTSLPAPVALASSFDPSLATKYGEVLGSEARSIDQDIILAPMINIVRTPGAGRNFETFGEDPFLTSILSTAEINGIQSQGVMADAKHFAANNQETDRMTIDTVVDERTLHEIYLPAFKASVDAGVSTFMCAYNRLSIDGENTAYACANDELLNKILRDQWGFKGFVMTDWYAVALPNIQSNQPNEPSPILAGLDLEMPSNLIFGQSLVDLANQDPQYAKAVDKSVYRILTEMEKTGLLDGNIKKQDLSSTKQAHAKIAKQIAIDGAVLLKNDNNFLPLNSSMNQKIVVIGHVAKSANYGGGGSSRVKPLSLKSAYDSIEEKVGSANLEFYPGISLDGIPIPANALFADSALTQPGLMNDSGTFDDQINFVGNKQLVAINQNNSIDNLESLHWNGYVKPYSSGKYHFIIQVKNGTAKLTLTDESTGVTVTKDVGGSAFDSASLIATTDGLQWGDLVFDVEADKPYKIDVTVTPGARSDFATDLSNPSEPTSLRLSWTSPESRENDILQAVNAASSADKVILFGFSEATEGSDKKNQDEFSLDRDQNNLFKRVLQASSPNTAIVLNVGTAVGMPWLDDNNAPQALLNMWLPGQEGGEATADILFGDAEAGGRLPMSIPAKLSDYDIVNDPDSFPGTGPFSRIEYKEGIFVGYRWYDKYNVSPRFPFGFGLSYTNFDYSSPVITKTNNGYKVSFTVTNTGNKKGSDVPQVYLGAPNEMNPGLDFAYKSLIGFEKVTLEAKQSKTVDILIDTKAFKYWDINKKDWSTAKGSRSVYLGKDAASITPIGEVNPI